MGSKYKRSKENYSSRSSVQRNAVTTKEFIESIGKRGLTHDSVTENEVILIDVPKNALNSLRRGDFLVLVRHTPDELSDSLVMALKGSQVIGFFPKPIDAEIESNISIGINYDCVVSDLNIDKQRVKVKFKRNN
jgi:hypothetical protein